MARTPKAATTIMFDPEVRDYLDQLAIDEGLRGIGEAVRMMVDLGIQTRKRANEKEDAQ